MKIDEMIKVMEFFLHKQCDLGRMKFTPYDDDNLIWHVVNDVFEEWKWYKEQDLIPRNKVAHELINRKYKIREFLDRGYSTEEIVTYFIDLVIFEPKAEYRGN